MKPLQILVSALAIAAIVVLPHLGLIPGFGYSAALLFLVWLVLRPNGERFSDIGFSWKSFAAKPALVGALAAPAILAAMQLLVFPFFERFVEFTSNDLGLDQSSLAGGFQLALFITLAWLIGGFYEEIVFHGFIFTRLEKMIPGRHATTISFVLTSILFGAYHVQMGTAGVFNALLVGAVYLGLFLYFERNLWASIVCHGVYNTLVMILISLGYL